MRLLLLPPLLRLDVDALEEVLVNEAKLDEQPGGKMLDLLLRLGRGLLYPAKEGS